MSSRQDSVSFNYQSGDIRFYQKQSDLILQLKQNPELCPSSSHLIGHSIKIYLYLVGGGHFQIGSNQVLAYL